MARRALTTEWLAAWRPAVPETVGDAACPGLFASCGPRGRVVFYRFTGGHHRERIRLGEFPALALADARAQVNEARERPRARDITVEKLAESYRDNVLCHRASALATWASFEVHVLPAIGARLASEVEPADLAALVRSVREKQGRRGGPRIAAVVLRELQGVFAHGVETGVLRMSAAATLRARAFGLGSRPRARYLDADEVRAFLAALDAPGRLTTTLRCALAFQLYVPLRSESLIGARWDEFQDGTWHVPPERLKEGGARPWEVPLPTTARVLLERLRDVAGDSPWVLASPVHPEAHVEAKALIHAVRRMCARPRAGFSGFFTVHDLRRTWRSWASDLGIDHVVAERCLGHVAPLRAAGFSNAADVYARGALLQQRADAMERVGAAFDALR